MDFFSKLNFRAKISILVFFLSITFFLLFIVIEDSLLLKEYYALAKAPVFPKKEFRIFFGLGFSLLSAIFTAFSFNLFYSGIQRLVQVLQSWTQSTQDTGDSEQSETEEDFDWDFFDIGRSKNRNDEFASISRALQLAVFQERARFEKKMDNRIASAKKQTARKILDLISPIPTEKIPGLDISLFPVPGSSGEHDQITILRWESGCLGSCFGFPTQGVNESAWKVRWNGILSFLQNSEKNEIQWMADQNLSFESRQSRFEKRSRASIGSILKSIQPWENSWLNLTLFTLDENTGHGFYSHWQEIPLVHIRGGKIRPWEKIGNKYLDSRKRTNQPLEPGKLPEGWEPSSFRMEKNDSLMVFSDRILSYTHLNGDQFLQELERTVLAGPERRNTRDLSIAIGRYLTKRYGKGILPYLAFLIIRKTSG